jgi:hypothetical protein
MAIIAFAKEPAPIWGGAAWVFHQIMDDVQAYGPRDPDVISALADAKDVNGLVVCSLNPELAERVTRAVIDVVTRLLAGDLRFALQDQQDGDGAAAQIYHEALVKLLALAKGETGEGER